MDIQFHCHEDSVFKSESQSVRAFSYTDYAIEPHNHDFYEMNIVLGGRGSHQIESATFSVKRGDVFVIPPQKVHAYYNTENLEVYHVLLRKSFVRSNEEESTKMLGYLQLMEIEPFLRQSCSDAMFLHLTHAQTAELERDLRLIGDQGLFDDPRLSPLRRHTVWRIIYYLSYLLHEQIMREEHSDGSKYRRQILDTLEYLHRHFGEKLTVSDLSRRVYLSRSTFLRSFEAACGCSPIQYLRQFRVARAMELLQSSELSKTEVAHACGFFDLSHMERSIREMTEPKA